MRELIIGSKLTKEQVKKTYKSSKGKLIVNMETTNGRYKKKAENFDKTTISNKAKKIISNLIQVTVYYDKSLVRYIVPTKIYVKETEMNNPLLIQRMTPSWS